MESDAGNNFHVIVKKITRFDGRRVGDFQEWDSKLRASFNKSIFNVLQG